MYSMEIAERPNSSNKGSALFVLTFTTQCCSLFGYCIVSLRSSTLFGNADDTVFIQMAVTNHDLH